MSKALIAQMRGQRKHWVELGGGKKLCFLRPPETECGQLRGMSFDLLSKYVCDWDGFTQVDLLGEGVGSSDEVKFDVELWKELFADRFEWVEAYAVKLQAVVTEHFKSKATTEKNSLPS